MNTSFFQRPVCVIGGIRLPFCRVGTQYSDLGAQELVTENLKELVSKYGLAGERLGEVALGTVFYPPSTWNFARDVVLNTALAPETPGVFVQRACATSLDAGIDVAHKIASGQIEVGIAGGSESMSNVNLFLSQDFSRRFVGMSRAKTWKDKLSTWKGVSLGEMKPQAPAAVEPTTHLSMGEHCELMAKTWKIAREEQDQLALVSHQNGVKAYERGFYKDLIQSFRGIDRDNNLRADTSMEKMAKLKPAFDRTGAGTLTAGNSSPLTDGAATVLLASESWAKSRGVTPLAYLRAAETAAIDLKTEGLLMAPAYAASRLLDKLGMPLQSFNFYEIHEAFAAQVLCTLKAWESSEFCKDRLGKKDPLGSIDRAKLNVAGGSVALGHPFGATGARIIATLAALLNEKGSGKGLISICTGGGMGTVAVMER